MITQFDYAEFYIATPYTDGDTTLDIYAKNEAYKLTDQKTDSLLSDFFCVGIERDDSTQFMGMQIASVAENGEWQGKTRYTVTFELSDSSNPMVGLANSYDGTTADDNIVTANKLDSLSADSSLLVVVGSGLFRQLITTFTAGTSTIDRTYGETLVVDAPWMFGASPNEDKIFKYDGTNPAQGIILTAGVLDDVETVATFGYKKSGFTGSWANGVLYVETDGTYTQTPTSTTKPFGQILNDSDGNSDELLITGFAPSDTAELTQAQAEDDTSTVFGTVSGERLAQAQGMLGEVRSFAVSIANALSVSDLQALGWAVCNGTTPASQSITSPTITANTPNLVDKFIRGDASASGATGGSSTGTIPSHNHKWLTGAGGYGIGIEASNAATQTVADDSFNSGGSQTALAVNADGRINADYYTDNNSGDTVDTIPPYYELVFMIKVR